MAINPKMRPGGDEGSSSLRCRHIRRPVKLDYARHRARPGGWRHIGHGRGEVPEGPAECPLWRHRGHGHVEGAERACGASASAGAAAGTLSYLDVARIAAEVDFGE